MECREAEELIAPYLLGALDAHEAAGVDRHIDGCLECSTKLREEGDIVVGLAYASPQMEVPARVKTRLLSRIAEETVRRRSPRAVLDWQRLVPSLSQRLVAHSAVVATAALMVVIVVGGFWFDNRLSGIEAEKEALAGQLRRVAEDEAEMKERLRDQGYLTYFASAPEVSTRQLSATGFSAGALGMVLASPPETRVVLVALDLPVLSADQVYRAWLVKEGQWYEAGSFTVDSTGFVQIGLELPEPLSEYQAIVITIGKAGASAGPLEQSVLEGDL